MADVDDGRAAFSQRRDLVEQALDIRFGQHRRGFVEDQQPAGLEQRTRNLNELGLAGAQLPGGL